MKSRRRIAFPEAWTTLTRSDYSRDLRSAKWGATINLRRKNPELLMSGLGQKQTSSSEIAMSALPPKADIAGRRLDVR
jgi:hypothetical protein